MGYFDYHRGSIPFGEIVSCLLRPYNRGTLVGFSDRFRAGRRGGVSASGTKPGMNKNLQIALMASVTAAFLSLTPCLQAANNSDRTGITSTTDDAGRTIYVNESVTTAGHAPTQAQRDQLMFWSVTERRWKPVPSAHVR